MGLWLLSYVSVFAKEVSDAVRYEELWWGRVPRILGGNPDQGACHLARTHVVAWQCVMKTGVISTALSRLTDFDLSSGIRSNRRRFRCEYKSVRPFRGPAGRVNPEETSPGGVADRVGQG